MKKCLAGLAAVLLLTGCSESAGTSSPAETRVVYKALPLPELYLEIPEDYTVTSSDFYEEYYVKDDASIIITEDTKGPFQSAYDYSISALVQYQDVTKELEVLGTELVQNDAVGVQILEFTYTMGNGDAAITKTSMAGYCTDSQTMYIITCKSDVDTYEAHREEFLNVMRSVSFVN